MSSPFFFFAFQVGQKVSCLCIVAQKVYVQYIHEWMKPCEPYLSNQLSVNT